MKRKLDNHSPESNTPLKKQTYTSDHTLQTSTVKASDKHNANLPGDLFRLRTPVQSAQPPRISKRQRRKLKAAQQAESLTGMSTSSIRPQLNEDQRVNASRGSTGHFLGNGGSIETRDQGRQIVRSTVQKHERAVGAEPKHRSSVELSREGKRFEGAPKPTGNNIAQLRRVNGTTQSMSRDGLPPKGKRKKEISVERGEHPMPVGNPHGNEEQGFGEATALEALRSEDAGVLVVSPASKEIVSPWKLNGPSGGRLLRHDPVFVADVEGNEYIATSNGREMQLLSVANSLLVHSWVPPAGLSVVAFARGASQQACIYVGLSDSTCITWNWQTNEKGEWYRLGGNWHKHRSILAMEASTTVLDSQTSSERIYRIDKKGQHHAIVLAPKVLYTTSNELKGLILVRDATWVVAYGPKTLVLGHRTGVATDTGIDFQWIELPLAGAAITCAASYPDCESRQEDPQHPIRLALGNEEGQILLFADIASLASTSIFQRRASPLEPQILHWHRRAVTALKFSKDGGYLISAGKETVLVIWQLSTGKRQYLPHLTSSIQKVSVNSAGDKYALQMDDNGLIVLSTSELRPIAARSGLQLLGGAGEGSQHQNTAAVLHPIRQNEILLAVPSSPAASFTEHTARPFLQTYDISTSTHVSRQALTRNNVTDFNTGPDRTPVVPPDVKLIALSADGSWMATVDEWMPPEVDVARHVSDITSFGDEQARRREVFFKVWHWSTDIKGGLWTLAFRADAPHARAPSRGGDQQSGDGVVLALAAGPSYPAFATMGEDGVLRIWSRKSKSKIQSDREEWHISRSVHLHEACSRQTIGDARFLGSSAPLTGACVSHNLDGSMLAIALTFTDGDDAQLIHFVQTRTGEVISKQGIVGGEVTAIGFLQHYLVVLSLRDVRVWDLATDSLHLQADLPQYAPAGPKPLLAVDQKAGTFGVFVPGNGKEKPALRVYDARRKLLLAKSKLARPATTLLPVEGNRGFVCLFDDATVSVLQPPGIITARSPDVPRSHSLPFSLTAEDTALETHLSKTAPIVPVRPDVLASQSPLSLLDTSGSLDATIGSEKLASTLAMWRSAAELSTRNIFHGTVSLLS